MSDQSREPTTPAQGLRLHLITFGCQMNRLDSELVRAELLDRGWGLADGPDDADAILYNTCSVRDHAEQKLRAHIGQYVHAVNRNPRLVIGVMGCQAQRDGEGLLAKFPHLRLVVGTRNFNRVADLVEQVYRDPSLRVSALAMDKPPVVMRRRPAFRPEPHRAQIAIMRGCDHSCTYCIVPSTRGREVHRPLADIVEEAKILVDDGAREIFLLGQNVDSWGRKLTPRLHLGDALYALDKLADRGLQRVFFVTSHPAQAHRPLFEAMRDCPTAGRYLHLPVQSGSDHILKAMKRGTTKERYLALIAEAREVIPDVGVASDFIVGFPGETDADFQETVDLMERAKFSGAFVFKYSPRPGTVAAEQMEDDVPLAAKKERNQVLLALQKRWQEERHAAMIGRTVTVLGDGPSKRNPATQAGRTRSWDNVVWEDPGGRNRTGETVRLRITGATDLTLYGTPADA